MKFPKGTRVKPSKQYPMQGPWPKAGVVRSVSKRNPDLRNVKWDDRATQVSISVNFLTEE